MTKTGNVRFMRGGPGFAVNIPVKDVVDTSIS